MISIVEEPVIAFCTSVYQAVAVVVPPSEILLAICFFAVARLYDISLASGLQEGFEPCVNQCSFILSKRSINQGAVAAK